MDERLNDGALDRATDPEYAAINPLAVVGLIVGLLGAAVHAALLAGNFLSKETIWVYQVPMPVVVIVIPLTGLVLSLAALMKILGSQGVQAGERIAIAGIITGAAAALIFGAVQLYGMYGPNQESRTLATLGARSYEVVDDLAAGRYANVYAMIQAEFRRRQAAGPEQFRRQFHPLFEGAGPLVKRQLRSLQVVVTADGQTIAPAEMRVELQRRAMDITIWFCRADDGSWEIIGLSSAETFESQVRHPTETAAPSVPAPYERRREHEH